MGEKVLKKDFTKEEFALFISVLNQQLDVLKDVIRSPAFGDKNLKMGAELEMYLVDDDCIVAPKSSELLKALDDPQYQAEINQYNIELNLSIFDIKGKPFTNMLKEMRTKTAHLEKVAAEMGVSIMPVGILPTLRQEHLNKDYMTKELRYEVMDQSLSALRGQAFEINIHGEENVSLTCDDVSVEGANTSFQVHMMVEHDKFADIFNAAQLTMPLVTAVAANSGILLGNRTWDETRVALFKQSLDTRVKGDVPWQEPARVSFGQGWVKKDSWELFAESVALYKPLIPVTNSEIAADVWKSGCLPAFHELSLHLGTSWPWHRPVYSNHNEGHVRIEFRAIPAGPTSLDMVANAAFAMGLAVGLTDHIEDFITAIPFRFAEYNFYRAAQNGLDASILWPCHKGHLTEEFPIIEVIDNLFPYAANGLKSLGVDQSEIDTYLGIISDRIQSGITGARWQKNTHRYFEGLYGKEEASRRVSALYIENAQSAIPVSQWGREWL